MPNQNEVQPRVHVNFLNIIQNLIQKIPNSKYLEKTSNKN